MKIYIYIDMYFNITANNEIHLLLLLLFPRTDRD